MFEKVNPSHPDKIADRIAGAIVDAAYSFEKNPKIAVEVLIGHGCAHIIIESSVVIALCQIEDIVHRIAGNDISVSVIQTSQDKHLAENQNKAIRCGDNGIFKGMPVTPEQKQLSQIVKDAYKEHPYDGKYIINNHQIIACQSNVKKEGFKDFLELNYSVTANVNPLGNWTGGTDVDSGATNRKLGSDMGDAVTGGGLHGKDLSKSDVSVNIYAHIKAQELNSPVELCCAIGDETIDGRPYFEIVEIARNYINNIGGFEKFAEWGLI